MCGRIKHSGGQLGRNPLIYWSAWLHVVRWHVRGIPASRASRGAPFVAVMEIAQGILKQFWDYGRQCVRSDNSTKVIGLIQACLVGQ